MKAIILCLLVASLAFAVEDAPQPAMDFSSVFTMAEMQQLNELKATKWGSIFMTLAELQVTAGPIDRLVQSLDDLVKELSKSKKDENKRFAQKVATHEANVQRYNNDITAAKSVVAQNKLKISSVLRPNIRTANHEIKAAKATIAKKLEELSTAKERRKKEKADFERRVQEHNQAIAAADDCIGLVSRLLKGQASLVEIKQATLSVRQLEAKIRTTHVTETPFIEALIALVSSQNFANKESTNRVLSLLQDFRSRLAKSLALEQAGEAAAKKAYSELKAQANKEISEKRKLIAKRTQDITEYEKAIEECNNIITIKTHELLELEHSLLIEKDTFRREKNTHDEIIAEIHKEIKVVKDCRQLFAGKKFGKYVSGKIAQIDK